MEGGDLAAGSPVPHILVVWEGLVVVPGPKFTQKRFARRVHMRRYNAALRLLDANDAAMSALWNVWMQDRPVTLLTYLPKCLLPALRRDISDFGIPHARLMHATEQVMSHTVAQRRDVLAVFDADPARALLYGPKGHIIRPEQAHAMERAV
jgi:hypothetical protein